MNLPASSSDAERGFSLMKRIKTDHRRKLSDTSLSAIMTVNLESAPITKTVELVTDEEGRAQPVVVCEGFNLLPAVQVLIHQNKPYQRSMLITIIVRIIQERNHSM